MVKLLGRWLVAGAVLSSVSMAVQAGTQTFEVKASANSLATTARDAVPLNTGITLNLGDALAISATGLWDGGGCGIFDANGTTCYGNDPITGINYFSLIGKIGADAVADNTWFKVGTSYSGVAASAGTLYLAFLDTDSFNNSGFVTASVTAVPEAASWALMLAGLAGVTAVRQVRRRQRA